MCAVIIFRTHLKLFFWQLCNMQPDPYQYDNWGLYDPNFSGKSGGKKKRNLSIFFDIWIFVFYRSHHGEFRQRPPGCKNVQLSAKTQEELVQRVPLFRQLSVSPAVPLRIRQTKDITDIFQHSTLLWCSGAAEECRDALREGTFSVFHRWLLTISSELGLVSKKSAGSNTADWPANIW